MASTSRRDDDWTEVSLLWSALLGGLLAMAWYAILSAFADRSVDWGLYAIFAKRGWIPKAETALAGWGLAILAIKAMRLPRQQASIDVLTKEPLPAVIVPDEAARLAKSIGSGTSSLFARRAREVLERFAVHRNRVDVVAYVQARSDLDASTLESSYAMVRALLWAIPILGFMGTVVGISEAVQYFSTATVGAKDFVALRDALKNVVGGLATAFDTTYVALLLSMIVMLPASLLQKHEEGRLADTYRLCNAELVGRLGDTALGQLMAANDVQDVLERLLANAQAELSAQAGIIASTAGQLSVNATRHLQTVAEKANEIAQVQTQAAGSLTKSLHGLRTAFDELRREAAGFPRERQGGWRRWLGRRR